MNFVFDGVAFFNSVFSAFEQIEIGEFPVS
eukprot:COSAG01_NODE_19106_length_1030_cov_4.919441_2_plen_29_part_01